MKKGIIVSLIILVCFYTHVSAQGIMQTIKGKVEDKESKEPLPGATIQITDETIQTATSTDASGDFSMKIPIGRHSFIVKFVGYEDAVLSNILVTSGKEIVLTIELTQSITTIKDVEVTASGQKAQVMNSMATVSVKQFNAEDASRYAGGLFDPSRMVGSFAGVGTVDGDMSEIVVRGNSPRGVLWRLEGIEIPNPNHFPDGQGGSGGSLSMISSDLLSNFDFLTGAFPSEYGNATSGIMDLNLRKGNTTKHEYSVLVGDVGTQISAEGPLLKMNGASFLINFRYSSFDLVDNLHLVDLGNANIPPKFKDLVFNINLPSKKMGKFELFGVGGQNATGTKPTYDSTQWNDWDKRRDELENHTLDIAGIKHQFNFANHNTYIKTVYVYSNQHDEWTKSYLLQNYKIQQEQEERYTSTNNRLSVLLNHRINERVSLRSGFIIGRLHSDMFQTRYLWNNNIDDTLLHNNSGSNVLQAYIQNKYRLSEKFESVVGVHYTYFDFTKKYSVEPRFSLRCKINEKNTLTLGIGIHSKIEALSVYNAKTNNSVGYKEFGNRQLGFTKAWHNVIGYELIKSKAVRLKAELYYQYLFNVPIVDNPKSNFSIINLSYGLPYEKLENKGLGKNYGLELTLDHFFYNSFYYMATLSLFNSMFRAGDGIWYNTSYNCNYISNVLFGKEIEFGKEKNKTFGFNCKAMYRGGYRITPVDLQASIAADRTIYVKDETNKKRLNDAFEMNAGLSLRKNGEKYSWIFSVDLQNIFDHKNILYSEYRGGSKSVITVKGVGFIPIINLKMEF